MGLVGTGCFTAQLAQRRAVAPRLAGHGFTLPVPPSILGRPLFEMKLPGWRRAGGAAIGRPVLREPPQSFATRTFLGRSPASRGHARHQAPSPGSLSSDAHSWRRHPGDGPGSGCVLVPGSGPRPLCVRGWAGLGVLGPPSKVLFSKPPPPRVCTRALSCRDVWFSVARELGKMGTGRDGWPVLELVVAWPSKFTSGVASPSAPRYPVSARQMGG